MATRYNLPGFDPMQTIKEMVLTNPDQALNFAKGLCLNNPAVNVHGIAEIFLNAQRIQEMSVFLVECMK